MRRQIMEKKRKEILKRIIAAGLIVLTAINAVPVEALAATKTQRLTAGYSTRITYRSSGINSANGGIEPAAAYPHYWYAITPYSSSEIEERIYGKNF